MRMTIVWSVVLKGRSLTKIDDEALPAHEIEPEHAVDGRARRQPVAEHGEIDSMSGARS